MYVNICGTVMRKIKKKRNMEKLVLEIESCSSDDNIIQHIKDTGFQEKMLSREKVVDPATKLNLLQLATIHKRTKLADFLLSNDKSLLNINLYLADLGRTDSDGNILVLNNHPLHIACMRGYVSIFQTIAKFLSFQSNDTITLLITTIHL